MYGGPGDDVVVTGFAGDEASASALGDGGPGFDLLLGSGDRDRLIAGTGADFLNGADGKRPAGHR